MSFMDEIRAYHTALEAAGHKLIRDEGGYIDTFRLDIDHHNGPECERCGQTWCQHCQPTVEPCVPKQPKQ